MLDAAEKVYAPVNFGLCEIAKLTSRREAPYGVGRDNFAVFAIVAAKPL
jgi:hypothetical protein